MTSASLLLLLIACFATTASAFSPGVTSRPALKQQLSSASSSTTIAVTFPAAAVAARAACVQPRAAAGSVQMGLFGLGWAEIGVIGVLALLFFGPERLAPLAKDLGKSASGLKEVADSFAEGMSEGETGVSADGGADAVKSASPPEEIKQSE